MRPWAYAAGRVNRGVRVSEGRNPTKRYTVIKVVFEKTDGGVLHRCELPFPPMVGDRVNIGKMVVKIVDRTITPMIKNTELLCTVAILGVQTDQ
jgi:hypothetical protein